MGVVAGTVMILGTSATMVDLINGSASTKRLQTRERSTNSELGGHAEEIATSVQSTSPTELALR